MTRPLVAIVDDDASVRRALKRLLASAGLDAITFASGAEYLEAGRSATPGCLVLDIHLGGMSGFDLHQRLTAAGDTVPVILITAHDDEPTRQRARQAGVAAYLRKPLDAVTLLEAIHAALKLRPSP